MSRHQRRQARDADRILAAIAKLDTRLEAHMSAASDALMQGLADLSAKLSSSVTDIEAARAEAEAAQAAKDDVTFNAANERVRTMLANLGPHVEAIGQMASAVASGAGTAQPVPIPPADVATASTETAVQVDPAVPALSTSDEAADAAPASSSDAPSSNVATGDVVPSDGDASAEDAAAVSTKRKR